jgi:G:T-mismatch repair DNA endonuclease (very short patch repair protein)
MELSKKDYVTWAGRTPITVTHPEIAAQWGIKNQPIPPETVSAGSSNRKYWWECERGHEWEAIVKHRTNGHGCPFCSGRLPILGETDLATLHPKLALEWHPTLNGELLPTHVTAGCNKLVWWKCSLTHQWKASINNRRSLGRNCPYCCNQKILSGYNDLASIAPKIAAEWDYELNYPVLPSQVASQTGAKFYWKCKNNHSWQASPNNRCRLGTGCGQCSMNGTSKMEVELADYIESLGCLVERNTRILPGRARGGRQEIDVYIPDLKLGIEFNGCYWHSEEMIRKHCQTSSVEYHGSKQDSASHEGITLVFVWEDDWRDNRSGIKQALVEFINSSGIVTNPVLKKLG